jgi:hypothetical protein
MHKLVVKWFLLAAGVVCLVCAGGLVAGFLLPPRIHARRVIAINRPPENVWWVLTDYSNMALWHPQYRNAVALSNPGDRPMRWRATYTDGLTATVEVSDERYPTFLEERITDPKLPFQGSWKIEMSRKDQTAQVTAESTVELRRPVDRLFVWLFVRPDAELEKILNSLKRRVESSTVKPSAATS